MRHAANEKKNQPGGKARPVAKDLRADSDYCTAAASGGLKTTFYGMGVYEIDGYVLADFNTQGASVD